MEVYVWTKEGKIIIFWDDDEWDFRKWSWMGSPEGEYGWIWGLG